MLHFIKIGAVMNNLEEIFNTKPCIRHTRRDSHWRDSEDKKLRSVLSLEQHEHLFYENYELGLILCQALTKTAQQIPFHTFIVKSSTGLLG